MQRRVELLQHFRLCTSLCALDEANRLSLSQPGLLRPIRGRLLLERSGGRGGRHGVGWSFGQDFLDESWRHGGGENRAISGLLDFEAVEKRLYIRIRTVRADAAFGGMKEAEKGGGLLGDGVRVGLTVGEGFRPQVESAEISSGNHGDRRLGKQEAPTAESAQGTHFGGLHAQNRKRQACQRNSSVELSQQRRSAKGRGKFPGAVEHAANHVGARMVRNRDAVIRKNDDANGAAFEGDVVDFKAAVIVNGRRDLLEIRGQAGGIEGADEDLGETRLCGRSSGSTSPSLRIVDGESGLVQIALELKARFLNKLLVFGLARDLRQLGGGVECPNPL